jgi:hypothetical protein
MTFRMQLEKDRRGGNGAYAQERTTSRVAVASRPKFSFGPDGSASTGNFAVCNVPLTRVIQCLVIRCPSFTSRAAYLNFDKC